MKSTFAFVTAFLVSLSAFAGGGTVPSKPPANPVKPSPRCVSNIDGTTKCFR